VCESPLTCKTRSHQIQSFFQHKLKGFAKLRILSGDLLPHNMAEDRLPVPIEKQVMPNRANGADCRKLLRTLHSVIRIPIPSAETDPINPVLSTSNAFLEPNSEPKYSQSRPTKELNGQCVSLPYTLHLRLPQPDRSRSPCFSPLTPRHPGAMIDSGLIRSGFELLKLKRTTV